jgi:hypothetical protein
MLARHGELLVEKIDMLPAGCAEASNVLATGKGGNAHKVTGDASVMEHDAELYILVKSKAKIIHPEHKAISLGKGAYKVIRQVEYTPQGLRKVED